MYGAFLDIIRFKVNSSSRDLATRSKRLISKYYVTAVHGLFYIIDTGILENERF